MLKILAKTDLAKRDIAPDIVNEYQMAARYSFRTWWQRAMTSNGLPLANETARQGFAIAQELDKREATGATVQAIAERRAGSPLVAETKAMTEQHAAATAALQQTQLERNVQEAETRRRASPGILSRLWALVDDTHAARLREQRAERVKAMYAAQRRDAGEREQLRVTQQATLQGLRDARQTEEDKVRAERPPQDIATRQQIINTQILVTLSSHLARPFGAQDIGRLHLAAISQGLAPGHPLAKDIDPTFMTGNGKLQADARVLAFGLTVAQAKQETLQLQAAAETAPHAAQEQAKRVQSLLREGFSSEAGKLFNRNLPPIKEAISATIDAIADRPLPPTAQVIVLRA